VLFQVCADEKEKRKDLFIVATSYMGQLKARKPQLIKENEFHMAKKGSANGEQTKEEGKAEKSGEKDSSKRSKSKEKSSAALAAAAAASALGSSSSKSERKSKDRESKERSSRDSKSKERSSRESKVSTSSGSEPFSETDPLIAFLPVQERRSGEDSRKSRERHSQESMGPPQSASQHRKSTEPADSERGERVALQDQLLDLTDRSSSVPDAKRRKTESSSKSSKK
jgi:THO complex subunit 2